MSEVDLTRAVWRKSSRSNTRPDQCVELAAVWRKSSRSNTRPESCVEVAGAGRAVAVRDSKNPRGGHLAFTRRDLTAFARQAKRGGYDR